MTQDKRVVIYVRVSSNTQEENTSLATQEAACRAYSDAQGLPVADVLRDVSTGANMDRPGLQAALDMVRHDEASVLVVHAYDRLAREQNHLAVILYEVEYQRGGLVLSVTEGRDDTAQGKFLRSALAFMAEVERTKIVERTQRGKRQRSKNGALPGSVALYGYRWSADRRTYEIDPATAPIVVRIFTEAAATTAPRSLYAIACGLTRDGIPSPSQRHEALGTGGKRQVKPDWSRETVRRLLRNPAFMGQALAYRIHETKVRVKNAETKEIATRLRYQPHSDPIPLPASATPALVTPELWRAANEQLTRNKVEQAGRSVHHARESLLRAGFAFCAHCGQKMYIASNGAGTLRYRCQSRPGDSRPCPGGGPSVALARLDADIWARVVLVLNTDAVALALAARQEAGKGTGTRDDLAGLQGLRARLDSYDGTLEKLGNHRKMLRRQQEDAGDDQEYDELQARITQDSEQLAALRHERDELHEQLEGLVAQAAAIGPIVEKVYQVTLAPDSPLATMPTADLAARIQAVWAGFADQVQAAMVQRLADALSLHEKRALLRWLGVRVEVYGRDYPQPDGTTWQLTFQTPTGAGPFPLAALEGAESGATDTIPLGKNRASAKRPRVQMSSGSTASIWRVR